MQPMPNMRFASDLLTGQVAGLHPDFGEVLRVEANERHHMAPCRVADEENFLRIAAELFDVVASPAEG